MKFYDSYSNTIRQAIQKNKLSKGIINESYSNFSGTETKNFATISGVENFEKAEIEDDLVPSASLRPLGDLMHIKASVINKLGEHPDFAHLKGTEKREMHYITSVFIDIKGSTNLHKKYDLESIHTITNTIQKAAIHTCIMFGGHIQRLQGDGVFIYFGGKNVAKKTSVENALGATSFFTYFVKNDLKNIFEGEGIEDINTRIGIDYGDDDKVMWANYGLGICSELTTNSLHTSLASKMQSYASTNGIVIGDNVRTQAQLADEYYDYVKDSSGNISKRYIFEDVPNNYRYTQFAFDWYKYLKSLSFIKSDENGSLYLYTPEQAEQDRIAKLRQSALAISASKAFTDSKGNINTDSSIGVKNQDHRFHHEE